MKNNFKDYTTLEQICEELGIDAKLPFDVSMLPLEMQKYLFSCFFLPKVCEFFNEGKELDYRRGNNQRKWFIWPDVEASNELPSGFGLSDPNANFVYETSTVGSRLCFLNEDHARHAFKHLPELYLNWHLKINQ